MTPLEKQVLRIIGEDPDSPDVFTDQNIGQIRDSINDAIQEITMLTGGHEDTIHVPLLTDKKFYRLNFERGFFGWVVDCWIVGEKRRLQQTDFIRLWAENSRWLYSSGTPWQYLQVGSNVLGLDRSPSSDTDILEVRCVVIPKAYDQDTDRIKLRQEFHRTAVNYAVSEYWASRGDPRSAVDYLTLYADSLGERLSYKPAANRIVIQRPTESQINVGE